MGLDKEIKKLVVGVVEEILEPLVNALILEPLKQVLKAVGFYKLIGWIESFFSFIKEAAYIFAEFIFIFAELLVTFVKFIEVVLLLIANLAYYATRPFEFIQVLVKLGLTFLTLLFAFAYHKFSLPNNLKIMELGLYVAIFVFIYTPLMLFGATMFLIYKLFFEYTILYNLDKSSGGYISSFIYRYFTACENPPDAWYIIPSNHSGNSFTKNIFAYNTCPQGFTSSGNIFSMFCRKQDKYEISTCPQANLYRLMTGLKTVGDLRNRDLTIDSDYLKLNKNKKEIFIDNYKETISKNNTLCESFNMSKDLLLKSYCMKFDSKSPSFDNEKYNQLCYDLYCKNKKEPFCHLLKDSKVDFSMKQVDKFQNVLFIIMTIVVIILIGRKSSNKPYVKG